LLDRLQQLTAEARTSTGTFAVVEPGEGTVRLGPLEFEIHGTAGGDGWRWAIANASDEPVAVTAVRLGWREAPIGEGARVLRHGYQSWSATGVGVLGVDRDPSAIGSVPRVVRGMHHADADVVTDEHELRSELVTVLDLRRGGPLQLFGFESGATHDGTFRVTPFATGAVEVVAEAYLGGALLAPGERRELHAVHRSEGDAAAPLLEEWAARVGEMGEARVSGRYRAGWCSWYHWFHGITEEAFRANLALGSDWPFDVFQLDDGYQRAIGDWLYTNDKFPTELGGLASTVARAGRQAGIWIAPFLASPDSYLLAEHPSWIARWHDGSPLVGMVNEAWGGPVYVLDTTLPEVLDHLELLASTLASAGWDYLKLDFTYAPSLAGTYHDPGRTPAERVRAGMEAVRRGADGAFILGCGLPIGAGVGVVDAMRIGPDVAPHWEPEDANRPYADTVPATRNAWRNTLSRAFQHRRLWLNDPDCLMLRTTETQLKEEAARAWALAVAMSGGLALVSDDLALLDDGARRLLDEVLTIGREVDAAAISGSPPRCHDLMEHDPPTTLTSAGRILHGDPEGGRARLSGRGA